MRRVCLLSVYISLLLRSGNGRGFRVLILLLNVFVLVFIIIVCIYTSDGTDNLCMHSQRRFSLDSGSGSGMIGMVG